MFEKLFDAGVFGCKLGTLDAVIRNSPLPRKRGRPFGTISVTGRSLPRPEGDGDPANSVTDP